MFGFCSSSEAAAKVWRDSFGRFGIDGLGGGITHVIAPADFDDGSGACCDSCSDPAVVDEAVVQESLLS